MPARAMLGAGQSATEHLSRHRNLGHLERDVAPVGDDLGPDPISFSRRLVSDQGCAVLASPAECLGEGALAGD